MLLALRILVCCLGSVLLSLALFTYEDEEKKLQSRLENFWVWLEDQKASSLLSEGRMLTWAARSMSRVIDYLFGTKLLSARAIVVSTSISFTVAAITTAVFVVTVTPSLEVVSGTVAITFVVLAFAFASIILVRRSRLIGVLICLCPFVLILLLASLTGGLAGFVVAASTVSVVVFLSLISDFTVIALVRRLLSFMSRLHSLSLISIGALLAILLSIFTASVPLLLVPGSGVLLGAMNAGDLVILAGVFAAIVTVGVHHALWPLLSRPIYSLQRSGLIANKKACGSLGLALIISATGIGRIRTELIWEAIKKLL